MNMLPIRCAPTGSAPEVNTDDHITFLVSPINIAVRLDHLLQRIAPVDDRLELTCFYQFGEIDKIFRRRDRCPTYERLAASHRSPAHLYELRGPRNSLKVGPFLLERFQGVQKRALAYCVKYDVIGL